MNARAVHRRSAVCATALAVAAGWLLLAPAAPRATAQWLDDLCTSIARPMFSSAVTPSGAAAQPATIVKTLSCEPLPNVPGKNVATLSVEFPPLARSAPHRHPGSVTAVVVEGTVRSQLAGGPVVDYQPGETFFEPPRILHVLAENPDPVRSAKLLAFFVVDDNCGPLTIPE